MLRIRAGLGRHAVVAALILTASALAAQTTAPPGPAQPTCTTTTVVVKRGEVVLSTTSSTRCEAPDAKPNLGVGEVLKAPGGLLAALGTGGADLTPRKSGGDWRTVEPKSRGVCHFFLTVEQGPAGYRVRTTGCGPALSRVKAWTFVDGGISLYEAGGTRVGRLSGDPTRVVSTPIEGKTFVFER